MILEDLKQKITLDFSRQLLVGKTLGNLFALAKKANLSAKIAAMFGGKHINLTEDRAVMHMALRARKDQSFKVDGANVVPDVHKVLSRISTFTDSVRTGAWKGSTGKPLRNFLAVGIGGSYLGPEFVAESLRTDPAAKKAAGSLTLQFLANVDPVDVARALHGLDPEETLVIIISKTFTTAETMLNARTLRRWLCASLKADPKTVVAQHMIAVSASPDKAVKFGIQRENVFGFWNWVGGRFSVCSAVGVVPLSLKFGFPVVQRFLEGANAMDTHFQTQDLAKNLPVVLGLLGVWNSSFLGFESRALLPYSQALCRFPAHIQQVDMESNGKRVTTDGAVLPFKTGEINFGEPGTNGQHSFYQLLHQGRTVPCDFIGFAKSQNPIEAVEGEVVSNHDELMSNFFAQPDALAVGKTIEQLTAEGVPKTLLAHKVFEGNRPSSSLLFHGSLDAFATGQLLSLYEHRTAVQGFVWNICSFDQWGVELGKVLAKQVRAQLNGSRGPDQEAVKGFNYSTTRLLRSYLETSKI